MQKLQLKPRTKIPACNYFRRPVVDGAKIIACQNCTCNHSLKYVLVTCGFCCNRVHITYSCCRLHMKMDHLTRTQNVIMIKFYDFLQKLTQILSLKQPSFVEQISAFVTLFCIHINWSQLHKDTPWNQPSELDRGLSSDNSLMFRSQSKMTNYSLLVYLFKGLRSVDAMTK